MSVYGSFMYIFTIALYMYFIYLSCASMFPHNKTSRWTYAAVLTCVQFFVSIYTPLEGYGGWLVFAFIVGRFLGVYHPEVVDNRPLDTKRKIIGWIAIAVFILSFSPQPFIIK
jgi:hypothetical protein